MFRSRNSTKFEKLLNLPDLAISRKSLKLPDSVQITPGQGSRLANSWSYLAAQSRSLLEVIGLARNPQTPRASLLFVHAGFGGSSASPSVATSKLRAHDFSSRAQSFRARAHSFFIVGSSIRLALRSKSY